MIIIMKIIMIISIKIGFKNTMTININTHIIRNITSPTTIGTLLLIMNKSSMLGLIYVVIFVDIVENVEFNFNNRICK